MADNIKIVKSDGSNGSSLLSALAAMETNTNDENSTMSNSDETNVKHSFLDHIKMRAVEEYHDVITYMELSKMTDEMQFKKMLVDIAKEEMTHGKCLEHIIMHSREMPEDIETARKDAEESIE